jgi:antitoxin component YwqK of YwqJK toxin-antitoxin module
VGLSQVKLREYLDENCMLTADSLKASFYRITEKDDQGWLVKDYYITGELEMVARCLQIKPTVVKDGPAVFYYKNGKKQMEGNYVIDSQRGMFKDYYENGRARSEINYKENKAIYQQFWDEKANHFLPTAMDMLE